jgi:hypothetical protein
MSWRCGVDVIFLKHPENHLIDLLGPLSFCNEQKGDDNVNRTRNKFYKTYEPPKDSNYIFATSGDDVFYEDSFKAIPEFLTDLEEWLEMVFLYHPEDKELIEKMTWKEWIETSELFVWDWEHNIPKQINEEYHYDWDNRTQSCKTMTRVEYFKQQMDKGYYPLFFNAGIIDWIKLMKEEILSIQYHETWYNRVEDDES